MPRWCRLRRGLLPGTSLSGTGAGSPPGMLWTVLVLALTTQFSVSGQVGPPVPPNTSSAQGPRTHAIAPSVLMYDVRLALEQMSGEL